MRSSDGTPEETLDVVRAMRQRRMHRVFKDAPVPWDMLERIAWAATRAQQARSGVRNVIIVDDERLMAAARQVLPGFVNNAPAMLVLCSDLSRAEETLGKRGVHHVTRLDAGAAVAYAGLMAQALGLGVCTVTSWSDAAVSALLDLPVDVRPDATLAIGFVDSARRSIPARGFASATHHNVFGGRVD